MLTLSRLAKETHFSVIGRINPPPRMRIKTLPAMKVFDGAAIETVEHSSPPPEPSNTTETPESKEVENNADQQTENDLDATADSDSSTKDESDPEIIETEETIEQPEISATDPETTTETIEQNDVDDAEPEPEPETELVERDELKERDKPDEERLEETAETEVKRFHATSIGHLNDLSMISGPPAIDIGVLIPDVDGEKIDDYGLNDMVVSELHLDPTRYDSLIYSSDYSSMLQYESGTELTQDENLPTVAMPTVVGADANLWYSPVEISQTETIYGFDIGMEALALTPVPVAMPITQITKASNSTVMDIKTQEGVSTSTIGLSYQVDGAEFNRLSTTQLQFGEGETVELGKVIDSTDLRFSQIETVEDTETMRGVIDGSDLRHSSVETMMLADDDRLSTTQLQFGEDETVELGKAIDSSELRFSQVETVEDAETMRGVIDGSDLSHSSVEITMLSDGDGLSTTQLQFGEDESGIDVTTQTLAAQELPGDENHPIIELVATTQGATDGTLENVQIDFENVPRNGLGFGPLDEDQFSNQGVKFINVDWHLVGEGPNNPGSSINNSGIAPQDTVTQLAPGAQDVDQIFIDARDQNGPIIMEFDCAASNIEFDLYDIETFINNGESTVITGYDVDGNLIGSFDVRSAIANTGVGQHVTIPWDDVGRLEILAGEHGTLPLREGIALDNLQFDLNRPPVTNADSYTVNNESTLTIPVGNGVLANDTDSNGDTLTVSAFTQPAAGGTVTVNSDGSLSFVPDAGFSGPVVFTYTATDGCCEVTETVTINVQDIPDVDPDPNNPGIDDGCVVNFVEGDDPKPIAPDITITDNDSNLTGLTLNLTGGGFEPDDTIAFDQSLLPNGFTMPPGVTVDIVELAGVPTSINITGTATPAEYSIIAQALTFHTDSENPSEGLRSISWTVIDDQGHTSQSATSEICIQAVNDPPVVDPDPNNPGIDDGCVVDFVEGDDPQQISPNIQITDVDSPTISGLTLDLTGDGFEPDDIIAFDQSLLPNGFTMPPGVTVDIVEVNGIHSAVNITGTATPAEYSIIAQALTFHTDSENPSEGLRSISWTVIDDQGEASLIATSEICVDAVADAPVITPPTTPPHGDADCEVIWTEGDAPVPLFEGFTFTDVDSEYFTQADFTLTGSGWEATDVITYDEMLADSLGLTIDFNLNPAGAVASFSIIGDVTPADFQALMDSVSYSSSSDSPSEGERGIEFNVWDNTATETNAGHETNPENGPVISNTASIQLCVNDVVPEPPAPPAEPAEPTIPVVTIADEPELLSRNIHIDEEIDKLIASLFQPEKLDGLEKLYIHHLVNEQHAELEGMTVDNFNSLHADTNASNDIQALSHQMLVKDIGVDLTGMATSMAEIETINSISRAPVLAG